MRILVTGASGFLGRHVVSELIKRPDVELIKASSRTVTVNGHEHPFSMAQCEWPFPIPDKIVHLAWEGLPNYMEHYHLTRNFPEQLTWLSFMLNLGVKDITVAGTCFEYGMVEGELKEDMIAAPANPYALAKDTLRRAIQLVKKDQVRLKWGRFFYLYGKGQNPNSLVPQLEKAATEGRSEFPMSGGQQVRDYLPVEVAASKFARLIFSEEAEGIYNVCSGKGTTILSFVQSLVEARGYDLELKPGVYPYPTWEPFEFWGNSNRIDRCR